MDAEPVQPGPDSQGAVSYEVRTGGGLVTIELHCAGRRMAFSTDRSSGVTMASDLLRAVRHAEAREAAERSLARERRR